eukprot:1145833-Pelagomonas_calceolata.AAC.3
MAYPFACMPFRVTFVCGLKCVPALTGAAARACMQLLDLLGHHQQALNLVLEYGHRMHGQRPLTVFPCMVTRCISEAPNCFPMHGHRMHGQRPLTVFPCMVTGCMIRGLTCVLMHEHRMHDQRPCTTGFRGQQSNDGLLNACAWLQADARGKRL